MNPTEHRPTTCVLVVPCYNEAQRLDLPAFLEFSRSHSDVRFLFVNDGSTDNTRALLQRACELGKGRFDLLDLEVNRGKAEAVRCGMLAAIESGAELIGFWDADLATPLDAIPEFLAQFAAEPDIQAVLGSRVRLLGRQIERRTTRHYLGRVFATLVSWLLGLPVYDTQCGAKMFRVSAEMRGLLGKPFCSRWIFDVEILARWVQVAGQQRAACGIMELPLRKWRDVPGSKLRARDFFRAAIDLAKIRGVYLRRPRGESVPAAIARPEGLLIPAVTTQAMPSASER